MEQDIKTGYGNDPDYTVLTRFPCFRLVFRSQTVKELIYTLVFRRPNRKTIVRDYLDLRSDDNLIPRSSAMYARCHIVAFLCSKARRIISKWK